MSDPDAVAKVRTPCGGCAINPANLPDSQLDGGTLPRAWQRLAMQFLRVSSDLLLVITAKVGGGTRARFGWSRAHVNQQAAQHKTAAHLPAFLSFLAPLHTLPTTHGRSCSSQHI